MEETSCFKGGLNHHYHYRVITKLKCTAISEQGGGKREGNGENPTL